MSVLGLDFGTTNLVIAVAQRGGVDIIANEASARLTPALISFDDKQRYTGEGAAAVQMQNLKNTIGNVKRLLGRQWSDPIFQSQRKAIGICNEIVEMPGDRVGIKVMYRGEEHIFVPEQLAGMLLAKLKQITEAATATKVADVVVSCPGYFNEAQRRALLDSIRLGGMNPLRIVNDLTAISLTWGLYKVDLDEKEPKRVMIIDIGDQAMSVGITEFTKSQAKIVSTAYEFGVSGSAIDYALANHFAAEFYEKRKIDLTQYPKSWFRLLSAVGKTKKMLNSNPTAPLNIECIYEEYDINAIINRDTYAELIKDVVAAVPRPIQAALDRAKLTPADLYHVEIVGSGSRTALFQHAVSSYLGKELSFTLNAEEALAKGCALQCAILSPHFRVREYHLVDLVDHPVVCTWKTINDPEDTAQKNVTILNRTSSWPAAKNVSFSRPQSKPFQVTLHYDESEAAPKGTNSVLSVVTVPKVPVPADGGDAEVRLKIVKNIHGLIETSECELVEKYEEKVTPPPAPMDVDPAAAVGATAAAATEGQQAPPTEEKKKKKIQCTPIPFEVKYTSGASKAQFEEWVKIDTRITEETRVAISIADAKNALESYVYDTRHHLCEGWAPYVLDADRDNLNARLEETGDWLYGDGENETKEVYEKKLLSLRALGDPIHYRAQEHEARPSAITHFLNALNEYTAKVLDTSDKYDHIAEEEKAKITAEIEKLRSWFEGVNARQATLALTDDPAFLVRDLQTKVESLAKMADVILSKPKPKPKPAPKPAETKMEEDTAQPKTEETPMETDSSKPAEEGKPVEDETKPVPDMEVD